MSYLIASLRCCSQETYLVALDTLEYMLLYWEVIPTMRVVGGEGDSGNIRLWGVVVLVRKPESGTTDEVKPLAKSRFIA